MRPLVMLLATGCAASSASNPRRPPASADYTVIDLSPLLDESLGAKLETEVVDHPFYLAMDTITLFDHDGSHYDPPSHVVRGGHTADAVSLEKLIGHLRFLDLSKQIGAIGRVELEGKVEPQDFVVAYVGCASHQQSCRFLGKEAAAYLASVPVKAFGTDMWTLADSSKFPAWREAQKAGTPGAIDDWAPEHEILLSHDIAVFEGLTNLQALAHAPDALIVALPLKIKGANGGPARVVALVPP